MSEMQETQEMETTIQGDVKPTQNNVPDLVKIGSIPSNLQIDYDTTVYEPVTKSQSFLRFQIDNKGILHSNSKLTISMEDGIAETAFFPLGVGVNSLIERATLKCGGKTLSEIDDWNHYMAYRSMFISAENNKDRESITTGRIMSYKSLYNTSKSASVTEIPNTKAKAIGLDTGMYVNASNARDNTLIPDYLLAENAPVFQISLADLFPFLKMNQIPLYMMRDPLFVELTLVGATSKNRLSLQSGATGGKTYNVDLNNTHLIIDHIYYPPEQMEAYAADNPQITLSYHDYNLSKQSLTPTQAKNNIRNIGGAGRIVTKVIHGISNNADDGQTQVLNNFQAEYPNAGDEGVELNVRYNNSFIYPIDVKNTARLYNLVTTSEGMTPFVPRDAYNDEGDAITNKDDIMGFRQQGQLGGAMFFQAHRLHKGERVSGKGIDLYTKYLELSGSNYTQRTWIEYLKIATITNGILDVYNA
jgi:hypothetical protein